MASRRRKTSIMMSTVFLAGMAVALGSAQAADPVDAVSPTSQGEARLEALVQKYAVLELEDDDRSARAFGRRASASQDGRLADVSTQAFEQGITSRRALLREVNALAPSSLTFDGQVDRRLLIGLLEASSHMAEAQRMWTLDPAIYLPAAEVGRILEPAGADPRPPRRSPPQPDQPFAILHRGSDLQDRGHDQAARSEQGQCRGAGLSRRTGGHEGLCHLAPRDGASLGQWQLGAGQGQL
jgi:hypothetical protein